MIEVTVNGIHPGGNQKIHLLTGIINDQLGGRIIVVGGKKYPYNQNNRTKVGNELSSQ
ncbi:hypothetical protein [Enterocloster citroniae]|uniref:hypothetical protein n=1 Tax=Enterocloster citroniae TaxID=358743 RepID=UPI0022E5FF06|nr:hypothetical protein [Enterocloster citroniae]